jgi:hypothetical protein
MEIVNGICEFDDGELLKLSNIIYIDKIKTYTIGDIGLIIRPYEFNYYDIKLSNGKCITRRSSAYSLRFWSLKVKDVEEQKHYINKLENERNLLVKHWKK